MLSLFFSSSPNGVQGSSDSSSVFYGGGGGFWLHTAASYGEVALVFTAFAGIFLAAAVFYTTRGRLKSPWSRRKRKHALSPQQWRSLFTPDGKLRDGGGKFLKKVRSGGVDPSIRSEVFPFLLGVYDLNSSKEERDGLRTQNRKEYETLRRQCRRILRSSDESLKLQDTGGTNSNADSECFNQGVDSPDSEDVVSARESLSSEERSPYVECSNRSIALLEGDAGLRQGTGPNSPAFDSESSDSESSEDPEFVPMENGYHTLQLRLQYWMKGPRRCAEAVGLKDYDHLEPSRIFHAARLVAILEAYAIHDPEIGYCQGMSDLLSPIITVMTEDHEAFWCFVGFMRKARHNFRLDEVGIRRQLNIVSKIIKCKDSHLYRHLEKLQAEDCFFVYRMVVVLFRRELTFEQTICLWEVMWADQAAIRAGIGKSAWSRIRQRAPPTDDLLLYAVAASVLQRRKQIIEKYSSMDEILRECNSMAGHLDVWKLLDDAHDLVVNLHNKV
ncbi:Ypt/Rab-GAP domain of gyp1p superfamily protein [Actinidia rufa]|uniref:Ypt/Rab-GAP domain of gyp1p superfamily protein n=1 Tax=Actinidia rufa TaxID=165716 RepID=A0A7J0G6J1_9ERIC|nr:Ypt/Rab-GAP domain of gyp1p superfamily protein [Actinidia rufa]